MTEQITDLRKRLIELEFQLRSCKDRIRDLEWMAENADGIHEAHHDRRRALDKVKYIYREMEEIQKQLVDLGAK